MIKYSSLTTIETGFRKLKFFTISVFLFCCITTISAIGLAFRFAEQQRQKIYVLDQGKSLILALQSDKVANRYLEAQDHIRRFHELFFTLAPNAESITNNINAALDLSDKRAYSYYNDLAEQGYFSRLITASISQSIIIDSIHVNTNIYPHPATTYAKVYIIRSNSITLKSLITTCTLIDIARSESNPHGFLIEKFEVIENKQLKETTR